MKKKIIIGFVLMVFLLSACNKNKDIRPDEGKKESKDVGNREKGEFGKISTRSNIVDIINGIYEKSKINKEFLDNLKNNHILTDLSKVSKDEIISYLGKEYSFKEGYVSENGILTTAYLTIILRVESSSEALNLADELKKGFDRNRWVCVVPEVVESKSKENLVILSVGDKAVVDEVIKTFEMLK